MSDLPRGWEWATLDEVARWGSGGTPKRTVPGYYSGDVAWAIIGDLHDAVVTDTAESISAEGLASSSAKIVPEGAVLLAMYGSIGKLGITGIPMATNQAIAFGEPYPGVLNARYLFHYLYSQRDELASAGKGATQKNISQTILRAWPIPMPPLNEQERIVAAIEEHLSRLDAAEAAVQSAQLRLRAFYQAILARAQAEGDEVALSEVLVDIEAGKSFKTPGRRARPDEWGVIRVSAMTWGDFDEAENKAVPTGRPVDPKYEIRPGDLLLSRANTSEYVGATVLVGACRPRLLLSDKSMRLLTKDGVNRRWLRFALGSPQVRSQMSQLATGTSDSMRNISQAKVRGLRVRVPRRERQAMLADEIEESLLARRRLEVDLRSVHGRTMGLHRSILACAISGQLVPQNPDDDPVSVLLERIRDQRASLPRAGRARAQAVSR